jgi:ATP-binding cassette, subfamily G (WHITE), member 2, PDR
LRGDASLTLSQLIGNFIMALIIGSVFYDLQPTTGSFYSRWALRCGTGRWGSTSR